MATKAPTSPLVRARGRPAPRRARRRVLWGLVTCLVVALAALAAGALFWSGITLGGDATALARVDVQPFGGKLEQVRAFGPGGQRIPLAVSGGRLTPRTLLTPGEQVSVEVVVRRPGWLGWALGSEHREQLTMRAPVRDVERALADGSFRDRLCACASTSRSTRSPTGEAGRTLGLAGCCHARVAAPPPARSRSRRRRGLGAARPPGHGQLVPAGRLTGRGQQPGARRATRPRRSDQAHLLRSRSPTRSAATQPTAHAAHVRPLAPADSHTLLFVPSGFGAPFDSTLRLALPRAVAVTGPSGAASARPVGSTGRCRRARLLRLQQLLAQAGYLPLDWTPAGAPVARTPRGASYRPRSTRRQGRFSWRYPNTPARAAGALERGRPEPDHARRRDDVPGRRTGSPSTRIPGAQVWHALLADAIAGKRRDERLQLRLRPQQRPDVADALAQRPDRPHARPATPACPPPRPSSAASPSSSTSRSGTMSGTNPDGSHYHDPGIRWISYFNGGDAIHAFNRASFGTPQSLGCVELPLDSAAKVWPYTPIGTLVTIE